MTLSLFALLSGTGVLLAQVAWNRQLVLITGGSVDATAAVLSAFMLGLGAGGAFFGRKAERSGNPVNTLRAATTGLALCSFLPLVISPLAVSVYPALYSSGLQFPARFLLALLLVFPATFFAGGLVPVMARLSEGSRGYWRTAGLYGLHSLGSALGGFLAGFILLEAIGVRYTLIAGAVLTMAALATVKPVRMEPAGKTGGNKHRPGMFYLTIYMLSGLTALCWEMVWNRQLTFMLGNSTYSFAAMGLMVLAGIGLGSMAGRRFAVSSRSPLAAFGIVQVFMGTAAVIPLSALSGFNGLSRILNVFPGWTGEITGDLAASFFYMIPFTFLMGMTFPLIVSASASRSRLGSDVGILSLANCLGAAAGPVIATRLLFSHLGVTPAALLLACLNALLGFAAIWKAGRLRLSLLAPAGAAVSAALVLTSIQPGSRAPEGMTTLYFKEGRTAAVSVFGRDWDGHRSLRVNGIEEVPVDQASLEAFYLLGHLPWGYNPGASSALAIALGGGITSGAVLTHPVDTLVCVEICPEVADASAFFERENRRPDLDPRFKLMADDGRNFLLGTGDLYDLIICDATHPGSSESWLLYTEEFYSSVLSHLAQQGVAAQWVPLHKLPVEEFRRILITWTRSFPYAGVHAAGGRHAVLVGSASPLELDIDAMFRDSAAAEQLQSVGFREDEEFFLKPLLTCDELDPLIHSGIPSNRDDRAPCQFIVRKCTGDPQMTIGENMSLMMAMDHSGEPHLVHSGQVLYWSMQLPRSVEIFRSGNLSTAMERRWLSVALSTGAELLYNEGRYREASELVDMAWAADPGWQRNIDLAVEIAGAQAHPQEDN